MISIGIGVAQGGRSPLAPYVVGGVTPIALLDFERGLSTLPWTLTRASVGTYTALDGTLQSAAVDVPRYTYMTGRRALLLENSATRLNGYVSIRSAWASAFSATLTDLSEAALGQFRGLRIASSGDASSSAQTSAPVTAGQTYAVKFLWKPGTSGAVRFIFRLPSILAASIINGPAAGPMVVNSSAAGAVSVLADRTRGAYRETVILFTPSVTDTMALRIGPYSTVAGETVNAYAWQVEAGAADTSWILGDAGVATTRAADVAQIASLTAGTYDRRRITSTGTVDTKGIVHPGGAVSIAAGIVHSVAYYPGGTLP